MLAYVFIHRYGRTSTYLTMLTFVTWLLSSIVLWELYRNLMQVTTFVGIADPRLDPDEVVYLPLVNQFLDDISNIDSCGGHSALTVCPENGFAYAFRTMASASHPMRTYPPLIWTWSTMLFVGTLGVHYIPRFSWTAKILTKLKNKILGKRASMQSTWTKKIFTSSLAFSFAVAVSIVAVALQLSLLALNGTLEVINNKDWSFGQIVAVTIWAAPLAEYLHLLARTYPRIHFSIILGPLLIFSSR